MPTEVALHVLHHFGDEHLGVRPDRFTTLLLTAMAAASVADRQKLAAAFPEYGAAFTAVVTTSWGLEWLRRIAKAAA